jgi:hypothetical protein
MISEDNFPNLLRDRLWHTTSPVRYQMILESGYILPNPPIPDQERWKASKGRDLFPYVRFIGGVSLFEFKQFDPESYSDQYPLSSWREFVPYRKTWGQSVWIEINRQMIVEGFINSEMLLNKWKQDNAYRHTIMPYIEAAHLGPIPREAFICVFRCGNDTEDFEEVLV